MRSPKSILWSLLIAASLSACADKQADNTTSSASEPTENADRPTTPTELPAQFYIKLTGVLGDDLGISMDLEGNDGRVNGSYFYEKIGQPLHLEGSIGKSAEITLTERNDKGLETGKFVGNLVGVLGEDCRYEGLWTNPKNQKKLPFSLTQVQKNVATFSYATKEKENCDNREQVMVSYEEGDELDYNDTMCTTISLKLIAVHSDHEAADKKINAAIEREICGNAKGVNALLATVDETEEGEFFEIDRSCNVITNDNGILSFSIDSYEFYGGAHPSSHVSFVNFDLTTGKQLMLKDLLKPGYATELNRIGAKIFFSGDNADDGTWDVSANDFKLNDNFAITTGGLQFLFNQYEIGPYAAGMPEVFIPYKDIQSLIPAGGLLSKIQRK